MSDLSVTHVSYTEFEAKTSLSHEGIISFIEIRSVDFTILVMSRGSAYASTFCYTVRFP